MCTHTYSDMFNKCPKCYRSKLLQACVKLKRQKLKAEMKHNSNLIPQSKVIPIH